MIAIKRKLNFKCGWGQRTVWMMQDFETLKLSREIICHYKHTFPHNLVSFIFLSRGKCSFENIVVITKTCRYKFKNEHFIVSINKCCFRTIFTFSRLKLYCGIIYHLLRRNLPHLWESRKRLKYATKLYSIWSNI